MTLFLVAASCTGGGGDENKTDTPLPGLFWNTFTVPDPGCLTVDTVEICGPSKVDRIEIIEESTAEILGACSFGSSDTATTGVSGSDGSQFWCRRSQAGSSPTEITVSSNQGNRPWIHAWLVRASDGLAMWERYHEPVGGVFGPNGNVFSDPYQYSVIMIAGYKKYTFTAPGRDYEWIRKHALYPFQDAGYDTQFYYTQPTAEVDVFRTLHSRGQMEEDVITPGHWKIQTTGTRGNLGAYYYDFTEGGTAAITVASTVTTEAPDGTSSWTAAYSGYYTFRVNPFYDYAHCDFAYATSGIRWSDACWFMIADPNADPMDVTYSSEDLSVDAESGTQMMTRKETSTGKLGCSRPRLILLAEPGGTSLKHSLRVVLGTTDICAPDARLSSDEHECDLLEIPPRCTDVVHEKWLTFDYMIATSLELGVTDVPACQHPPQIPSTDIHASFDARTVKDWYLMSSVDCVDGTTSTKEDTRLLLAVTPR